VEEDEEGTGNNSHSQMGSSLPYSSSSSVVDEVISRAMAKYQTLMQNNPSQSNSWSSPSTVGGLGLLLRKMKVVGGGSRERERV
jgi:hypothetical protein